MYLQEILGLLNSPATTPYKHPFTDDIINEGVQNYICFFRMFIFVSNRPYGYVKIRKRGRVKRKIMKRIVSINRMVDQALDLVNINELIEDFTEINYYEFDCGSK